VSQFGKLICTSGPLTGKEFELQDDIITIGRTDESTICLVDDQTASRQHAEIRRSDNAYQVHDLRSKNGVIVNGRRLSEGATAWLEDGIEVQFASTKFRFQDPSATMTAAALIAVGDAALMVKQATREVFVHGERVEPPLSVKQFELLWYLYQHRNEVKSKDEIAQAVWPEFDGDVYDANIDRMVSRIRSRVEPSDELEPRFIITIRGYGYKLNVF